MTAKAVLIAAKAKIVQGWTQGSYSRDASGRSTLPTDHESICWCMAGALYASGLPQGYSAYEEAKRVLRDVVSPKTVTGFNDAPCRTVEQVLEKFDEAILIAS